MAEEPESIILHLLRGLRADFDQVKVDLASLKTDVADTKSELHSLRADVASDLMTMQAKNDAEHKATRKMVSEQIVGLRRAVVEYHSTVVGHGMLISDLEARVRRLEDRVGISDALL